MSVEARGAPNWPLKRRVRPDALCCKCLIWLVSVSKVLESEESLMIQGRWPDSREGPPNVDDQEPQAL